MINTNDQRPVNNLMKQLDKNDLMINTDSVKNDYFKSEISSVSYWTYANMYRLFANWLTKRRPSLIKQLQTLQQKHKYREFLLTLVQPELLPIWDKIVSTKELTVLFANNLDLAIEIENFSNDNDVHKLLATAIIDNFSLFFDAIISNRSFVNRSFSLKQILFILNWCNLYYEDYLPESEQLPYKVNLIISTLLPIILERSNFRKLNDSARALVNRVEIVTNAPKMSLSCFVILADRYEFATVKSKYDNTQFICRDKADFDRLIDWADDYGREDECCTLIKLRAKQINLGWYKRYATKKSKEHNDNIDNDDLYLYTILAKDTQ